MQYLVPFLIDADRNPVGLFSVNTSSGPLVFIFSNKVSWTRFASVVAPVLAKSEQYIGSTPFQAASIDDVAEQLVQIDPTLDGSATFVPDTAPILDDVVTFFEQSA
jgi:hypothetical protein